MKRQELGFETCSLKCKLQSMQIAGDRTRLTKGIIPPLTQTNSDGSFSQKGHLDKHIESVHEGNKPYFNIAKT